MFVFLYPENILQPSLRKWQTPAFQTLVNNTRSSRTLTSGDACREADRYSEYFQDICTLKVEASCTSRTRLFKGDGCSKTDGGYRCLFYMFGRGGTTNSVYWSAYDMQDSSGHAQTFWEPVEVKGLDNVIEIIGATPYQINPTQRFIFLFVRKREGGQEKLACAKYDLENRKWLEEVLSLDAAKTLTFSAVVKQQDSEIEPPQLAICEGSEGGGVRVGKLTSDGEQWARSPLDNANLLHLASRVDGMVTAGSGAFYLISTSKGNLECTLHIPNYKFVKLFSFGNVRYLGAFSWPGTNDIFVATSANLYEVAVGLPPQVLSFWLVRDIGSATLDVKQVIAPFGDFHPPRIAPTSGVVDDSTSKSKRFVYQRGNSPAIVDRFVRPNLAVGDLYPKSPFSVMPSVSGPFNIASRLSSPDLLLRKGLIKNAFMSNKTGFPSNLAYLEEAYYFAPIHLALALQKSGEYIAALDLLRTVYDYTSEASNRKIYYGLVAEESLADTYKRSQDWLLDPLNPHLIAATRQNTYTRFTLLAVIRCLLDYADAEFTQDTPESNPRARRLYLTALELLEAIELRQSSNKCDEIIGVLDDIPVLDERWQNNFQLIKGELKAIPDLQKLQPIVDQIRQALVADAPLEQRFVDARAILNQAITALPPAPNLTAVIQENENFSHAFQRSALADSSLATALQSISTIATEDFQRTVEMVTGVSPARLELRSVDLPWLREPIPVAGKPLELAPGASLAVARRDVAQFDVLAPTYMAALAQVAALQPMNALNIAVQAQEVHIPQLILGFCIPPNPLLKTLGLRAELNLYKLRTCRNIAGLKRQLEPYAAPTDTFTGLPTVGSGGQLLLPGVVRLQPTLYRYPVLIERAKQLIQLAGQIEAAMFSTLVQRDIEAYNLLRARQELNLAQASVQLQRLRITEAKDGVTLAGLQKKRAENQLKTYQAWIQAGINEYEKQMIQAYGTAAAAQKGATEASRKIQVKQAAISSAQLAAQVASASGTAGIITGPAFGVNNFIIDTQWISDFSDDTKTAIDSAAAAQIASVNASFERRKQEWELQVLLATQDVAIGDQQITLANDRVEIVTQEKVIEELKTSNAKDTIEFLTTKFTNVNLYDWMSGILEGVYRFFLQQGTAMAKLAENQLAFQRQESPPAYIQADYWNAPADGATVSNANPQATDRKGLTGSARLLQDIYQLDQYAFGTNKRKMQLTKTVSLARLVPVEFERFRETGVLPFATPMEMFDRGFPGHYLRLIKQVRTSIIALVPPMQGIHATLSTIGPSRVVIGGDVFQTVPILRAPEFIAISAPNTSTNTFELESQPDMLLPFEGSGVEMNWEFNMPRAANLFDYRTIADVLITLEYTALYSSDYRQQIIQSLKPTVSADRPFSFRNQFADQWYDLHNPEQTSTPMRVGFTTLREDFPPNIEALKIQHVLLYFVRSNAMSAEVPVSHLRYTAQEEAGTVGGSATSIDGIISTRRGNAGSWTSMIGKSPAGKWELALPNIEEIRDRFGEEDIEDILLVITYSGRTSDWPV